MRSVNIDPDDRSRQQVLNRASDEILPGVKVWIIEDGVRVYLTDGRHKVDYASIYGFDSLVGIEEAMLRLKNRREWMF